MDRRGIKTLLILLLLVADMLLLGLFLTRRWQSYRWERELQSRLEVTLESYGLLLDGIELPQTTVPALEHRRSAETEQAAAQVLLGDCRAEDQGGGIALYTGERGTARFRALGEFEILPEPAPALMDPAAEIVALAHTLGLLAEGGGEGLIAGDSGYTVYQSFNNYRLTESAVTFTLDGDALVSVGGRWLTGGEPAATGETGRTAGWALLILAEELDSRGQAAGRLLSLEPVYRMAAVSAGVTKLLPCWLVTLETGEYLVNALSGEITVPVL